MLCVIAYRMQNTHFTPIPNGEIHMNKKPLILTLSILFLLAIVAAPAFAAPAVAPGDSASNTLTADAPPVRMPAEVDWFAIAIDKLGMDEDALFDALDSGQTLTEIARSQQVDPKVIADAIVAAECAWLDELVAQGEITADEAAQWKDELPAAVDEFMTMDWTAMDMADDEFADEGADWFAIAAEKLGLDEDALFQALESGQSLAELAQSQNVDSRVIADAIIAAESSWGDELVANGEITADEAAQWKAELAAVVNEFMTEKWTAEGY
jgi:polyhydroxyalkanoate synthesis regulator phasin